MSRVRSKKGKSVVRIRKSYIAIGIIAIVVAGAYLALPKVSYTPLKPSSEHAKGSANAPITIIEYADFQCPACGSFWKEMLPQLTSDYVKNGTVKVVFKHFPLRTHAQAFKAAEASECAGDQGKFWEYHDALFANQNALIIDDLKKHASQLLPDMEKFNACLDSGAMSSRISDNLYEGNLKGVTGTPTFFVNDQMVFGVQSYSAFKSVIEQAKRK